MPVDCHFFLNKTNLLIYKFVLIYIYICTFKSDALICVVAVKAVMNLNYINYLSFNIFVI